MQPPKELKVRPLPGQCLLRILPQDTMTASGLHLPDIAQDRQQGEQQKPSYALVIAVSFKVSKSGRAFLPEFAPGQKVIVSHYSGTKLARTIGENLRLCDVDQVLAVVTE